MKSKFRQLLDDANTDPAHRRWLFIPYDQLSDQIGPLSREPASELGIIVVENPWKPSRRPYHKQKLAIILANLRHFAIEQARRGVAVLHLVSNGPYRSAFDQVPEEFGTIRVMTPAEHELRVDLQPLYDSGRLQEIPHEGWLTTADDFNKFLPKLPWRMDVFYRKTRQKLNILMQDGKFAGGKLSFDSENRQRWDGSPPAPPRQTFALDDIKNEVGELIEKKFSRHPGQLDLHTLPATASDAELMWSWAKDYCLASFGPYEDAMSTASSGLFHTRVSTLLNINRLLPSQILNDVLEMIELPLASREGFIRQIVGWREYMHHIHANTDGFRKIGEKRMAVSDQPGDGGYKLWTGKSWLKEQSPDDPDGGAMPSQLDSHNPLPPAYWGVESGLHCLDHIVATVWQEGWSHHITRLMVLSNIAALMDVEPRELTDWFWVAYTDAYDWVVEPNVLAMSTFSVENMATTKPYVCGAAYINRMSNYCRNCAFDPAKNCPITPMYWQYLERHADQLSGNQRLNMPYNSLAKRAANLKLKDKKIAVHVINELRHGRKLHPSTMPVD